MPKVNLSEVIKTLGEIAVIMQNEPHKAISGLRDISVMIDAHVPYRDGHNRRVAGYAVKTGERLGLPETDILTLEVAALLHDFGKIGVDDEILEKPSSLHDHERAEIEKHVMRGYHMLSGFAELGEALDGIQTHHEHFDGNGYPQGLADGYIPLFGRIIAVVDAYDAMTSNRPYRKAMSGDEAVAELKRFSGIQFDPRIVETFLGVIAS